MGGQAWPCFSEKVHDHDQQGLPAGFRRPGGSEGRTAVCFLRWRLSRGFGRVVSMDCREGVPYEVGESSFRGPKTLARVARVIELANNSSMN